MREVQPTCYNPSLTDYQNQPNLNRGSTHPTELETEVNQFGRTLQTHMLDVTSDPALMLNFKSEVADVPTINLTGTEATITHPPLWGNITLDAEEDMNTPTTVPGHSSHSQGISDESFWSMAPSLTGCTGAPAVPSTSVLQDIPTASLSSTRSYG